MKHIKAVVSVLLIVFTLFVNAFHYCRNSILDRIYEYKKEAEEESGK